MVRFRLLAFGLVGLAGLPLAVAAQVATAAKPELAQPRAGSFAETVEYSFGNVTGSAAGPHGNVVQAIDGNLWGLSTSTGAHGLGNIFKITPAGVYTNVFDFTGTNGAYPFGSLIVGHDGQLYGVTSGDSTHNSGTIFKITVAGGFTNLYTFTGGEKPSGALIQDGDSNLYGTTQAGGANGLGELYQYSNAGELNVIYSCTATDCANPAGGLLQASDGNGYGVSSTGGASGLGSVYRFTPGTGVSVIYSFDGTGGSGPSGGLLQTYDGLWGTTSSGGANGSGVLYLLSPTGSGDGVTYTDVYDFTGTTGTGGDPEYSTLTLGGDGNLYGTTSNVDTPSAPGGVFEYSPTTNTFNELYAFGAAPDGNNPEGGIFEAVDGTLWGTTTAGGAHGSGTIYKITPSTPIASSITLTANPTNVAVGGSSTLTYAVNNAYSDTAMYCDGFVTGNPYGQFPTSGSTTVTLNVPATEVFAYSCGGTQTAIATVSTLADVSFTSVTHNMGSVLVNTSTTGTANYGVRITNNEPTAVTFTGIYLSGSTEFTERNTCKTSMPPGGSCEVVFTFSPTALGTQSATWFMGDTPAGTTFAPSNGGTLTGTGVSPSAVTLTSASHNFGKVSDDTTSSVYGVVLTNSTTAALQMSYGSLTSPFLLSGDNCGAVLAAGLSCNLQFEFAPNSTGTYAQTFALSATANGAPVTISSGGTAVSGISLSGTGK